MHFKPRAKQEKKEDGQQARLMSAPPENSLTEATVLLNSILASAETIRTLSNATITGQQPMASASSADKVDSRLASLFPTRQRSSGLVGLPTSLGQSKEGMCATL